MNSRDIAYWERTLSAWGHYVRQGRCFPNTLGYPSSTVESSLIDGTGGSNVPRGTKVPSRFTIDKELERLDRKITTAMPTEYRIICSKKWIGGMSTRDMAKSFGISQTKISNQIRQIYAWVHGAMSE